MVEELSLKKFTSKQKSKFIKELLERIQKHYEGEETMDAEEFIAITIKCFSITCDEDQTKEFDSIIGKALREEMN